VELLVLIIEESADAWRIRLSPAEWVVRKVPDYAALDRRMAARAAGYRRRLDAGGKTTELRASDAAAIAALQEWLEETVESP
jgi:hypothetical protein